MTLVPATVGGAGSASAPGASRWRRRAGSRTPRTSSTCSRAGSRRPRWRGCWTSSSPCTPITSSTPRRSRRAWPSPPSPICTPPWSPPSPRSRARATAAPTRTSSRCCSRSATRPAPRPSSRRGSARAAALSRRERSDPRARMPGFGHRVYKVDDARARVLRGMAKSMAEATGRGRLFEVAERLYDSMRARTSLPVNVDFFSAVVYDALGIPPDFCTSIFAVGPRRRLVRPRARAIRGQSPHPPPRRRTGPNAPASRAPAPRRPHRSDEECGRRRWSAIWSRRRPGGGGG